MLTRITQLQASSEKARKDLDTFNIASTNHSSTLQTNEGEVKKLLDDGEIKRLEGEIKSLQKELDAEHDELSYGLSSSLLLVSYTNQGVQTSKSLLRLLPTLGGKSIHPV